VIGEKNTVLSFFKRLFQKIRILYIKAIDSDDCSKLRDYYKKKYNVHIGKYTYGYEINSIGYGTSIGSFCSIAQGVKIGLMNHPMQYVSTNPFLYYSSRGFLQRNKDDICFEIGAIIEDDVWIGTNAVILPGIVVGKGSVVAAGAVVTKNVSPYEIVGGVPARHIKWRFDDEKKREKLCKIDWANWDDEKIRAHISEFYEPDKFLDRFSKE
jgi:acetyltransferase-like isoleucine patch superfamily enzyme